MTKFATRDPHHRALAWPAGGGASQTVAELEAAGYTILPPWSDADAAASRAKGETHGAALSEAIAAENAAKRAKAEAAWERGILESPEGRARPIAAARLIAINRNVGSRKLPVDDARAVLRGLRPEAAPATGAPAATTRTMPAPMAEDLAQRRKDDRRAELKMAGLRLKVEKFGGEADKAELRAFEYAARMAQQTNMSLAEACREMRLTF